LTAKVAPDCHVRVDKVLYSVPWRFIGQQVDALWGSRTRPRLLSSGDHARRRGPPITAVQWSVPHS
jgi:hypothetical protein